MKPILRIAAWALAGSILLSSCAAKEEVPVLQDSAAVSMDTAVVQRGDLSDIEVYHAAVVPAVTAVAFPCNGKLEKKETALGKTVQQGDVLAVLDTEDLEQQIADLEAEITFTKTDNAYTNEQLELQIRIAELQLQALTNPPTNAAIAVSFVPQIARLGVELLPIDPNNSLPAESVPETSAPESNLPESSQPESSPPESGSPESSQPESNPPEESEPESQPELPSAAAIVQAKNHLKDARTNLSQEKELQQLRLQQMNDRLAALQEQRKDNRLLAPCSGVIVYETSVLAEGAVNAFEPIFCIADESDLSLAADEIPESKVKTAAKIEVQIGADAYPIEYIPYTAEEYSALILAGEETPARFRFTDEKINKKVAVGEYGAVMLYSKTAENVLYLPVNALHEDAGVQYVYVRTEDGQRRAEVEVGIRSDTFAEIKQGVEEGDVVYVQE